jgi:host factor-I protein
MSKAAMNLQDSFLNQVRRENSEVRVLLVNGTLLRGIVKGFDNFTLILNNRNGQHLVYKHAIAQIVSHRPHVKPEDMHEHHAGGTEASDEGEDSHGESAGKSSQEKGGLDGSGAERSGSERGGSERSGSDRRGGERSGADKGGERPAGGERSGRRDHARENRPPRQEARPKKEGFNTLDLSGVKIGEK